MPYMFGTIHHMILIYGAHVENYNISRYFVQFFKILIFWIVAGVNLPKLAQNDNKIYLLHSISQEAYII